MLESGIHIQKAFRLMMLWGILLFGAPLKAQQDSIVWDIHTELKEGIYLSYADFRANQPIPKEKIHSTHEQDQLGFFTKTIKSHDTIVYENNGVSKIILTDSLWGFYQNNILYIKYAGTFYRVSPSGYLSAFLARVEVTSPSPVGIFGVGNGAVVSANGMQNRTFEFKQFFLDFYTGAILDCTPQNLMEYLKLDTPLAQEYAALKKKKQKEKMIYYIRKFNENHPAKFPQ